MKSSSTRQPMRQAMILCLGIIMIMSAIPVIQAGEEANEYTTIVLVENKEYEVGDTVTLEIRFYQKDTLVDPDDINITIGHPEWGDGRYIEVDENSSRVGKGIYRVTFTIEEGDDPRGMGSIIGDVRCTISTGRNDKSDTMWFWLDLEDEEEAVMLVLVQADKPLFRKGDTVRFTVAFRYNGSLVDPDYHEVDFLVNREEWNITLIRESEGIYYYDYLAPMDDVSKNLVMEVLGQYNDTDGFGDGIANLDYYQIWLNTESFNSTELRGQVGVCDMEGRPVEIDIELTYSYQNGTWATIEKTIAGTTNADGLLDVTLDFDDIGFSRTLDVTIWANDTTRNGKYHQYANIVLNSLFHAEPGEGFDVILENEMMMMLPRNDTVTINYTAYFNGTELTDKEIVYFYHTPSSISMYGLDPDGEIGQVHETGTVTTDGNGQFSIELTTPDEITVIEDMFKADFNETRSGEGDWEAVMAGFFFIGNTVEFAGDLDVEVENFGLGQEATVTVTRDGQDGGRGGVHLHPVDPEATEDGVLQALWGAQTGWMPLIQHEFQSQVVFTGDEFSRDLGIPGFLPDDLWYILLGGILKDEGTDDEQLHIGFIMVDKDGNEQPSGGEDKLKVNTDAPDTLDSEESVEVTINITGSPPVEDADVTIEVTGAGSSDITEGTTDSNGQVTFTLTADNVTDEDDHIYVRVNASKSDYEDGTYDKVITVKAYIPPKEFTIGTNAPETLDSEDQVDITINVTGSPPVEGADVTIEISGPGNIDISEGTTDSNGEVTFTLTADNVTNENDRIRIWINVSRDGYADGMYYKVITVNAYVAPRDMVITSDLPDTMESEQIVPMVITVMDGGQPLEGVNVTLALTGPGHTCKDYGITDEDGKIYCSVTIDNVTGEDTTVTVYFNGTLEGYNKGIYSKVILIEAWNEPAEGEIMTITTNLPDTMYSDQGLSLIVTVTGSPGIPGVDITLETTGPGHSCKSKGVTNGDGIISCSMTIHNVTGEDAVVILYLNGTKDGYQDAFYTKIITVTAWIPPLPEVVLEPVNVDLDGDATASVIAGVRGNVTLDVQAAVNPDGDDTDALGLYLDITSGGNGTLNWVYIRIDYDQVPSGIAPEDLMMYYWDAAGERWIRISNSGVNTVDHFVWANVTHLTIFAPRQDPADSTPPSITHTAITEGTRDQAITIKAAITDAGDGVQGATLSYRKDGDSQYTILTMTKTGASYEATIPAGDVTGKDILYYIEATDGTNTATHPANKANPHKITIKSEGGDDDDGFLPGFGIMLLLAGLGIAAMVYSRKRD